MFDRLRNVYRDGMHIRGDFENIFDKRKYCLQEYLMEHILHRIFYVDISAVANLND